MEIIAKVEKRNFVLVFFLAKNIIERIDFLKKKVK